jgi:sister-chromatid-cohesion protein PDS5
MTWRAICDRPYNKGVGAHPLCKRYADILEAVAVADSTSIVTVW